MDSNNLSGMGSRFSALFDLDGVIVDTEGLYSGFWQGIARLFGTDLKAPYDPDGEDRQTEELVQIWERGEFEGLYYSLFWQYPTLPEIPSKYM